jgi:hypothetical protein
LELAGVGRELRATDGVSAGRSELSGNGNVEGRAPVEEGLVEDGLVEDGLVEDGVVEDGVVEDGLKYVAAELWER